MIYMLRYASTNTVDTDLHPCPGLVLIGSGSTKQIVSANFGTGKKYKITITNGIASASLAGPPVDLNGQWIVGNKNPDSTNYDQYMSNSNIGINNSTASMKIVIQNLPDFSLYINSYAESNWDYTIAWDLDTAVPTYSSSTSSGVKAHTSGKQYAPNGSISSNYTKVDYPNDGGEHVIWITYRKDSSTHRNDDRGYILIPK